jgi:hypothetical protein
LCTFLQSLVISCVLDRNVVLGLYFSFHESDQAPRPFDKNRQGHDVVCAS